MALVGRTQWKEELHIVDEQGRSFMFDCGWGGEPPVAYVPPSAEWTACVPAWLHGRRDEVIDAMKAASHTVADGLYPPLRQPDPRERS